MATVEKPIFIVGCGRTGSTLTYNILCGHKDLAWFSNFTTRFTHRPQLAILNRLYYFRQMRRLERPLSRFFPVPSEAYEIWDVIRPVENSPGDPPLTAQDATPEEGERAREYMVTHMRMQGTDRFINKNTRNTRRIGYLNALFPDAQFIHLVRDPRATVNSLLRVDWWPDLPIWNAGHVTPNEWKAQGNDPITLAAQLWVDETQFALDAEEMLGERYLRMHYEDIISSPYDTMQQMLEYVGLPYTDRFAAFIDSFKLRSMNFKYKERFTEEQLTTIEQMVAPVTAQLDRQYL